LRTAKSCGPDAPTLASSWRRQLRWRRWQTSPVTGESAKETVKTIARGMPGVSGVTVVTNARVYYTPRAAAGAPGARHSLRPLFSEGSTFRIKLGRIARRDRESVFVNDGCCLKFESAAHPCYASSARRDPTNNDRCWLEPKWSIIVPKREAAASRWAQLRSRRGSGSRRACHRARIRAPRWLGPDDVERWGASPVGLQ
jgi:hypothetical protein